MTTPHERRQALRNINILLIDFAYLKTRKERLERLEEILRHYPTNAEIQVLFEDKEIFEIVWGKKG